MKKILLLIITALISACEKAEYDYPQTLRYEIIGDAFYANYYDRNSTVRYPYSSPHHVPVDGIEYVSIELPGMNPGDSISLFVAHSKTPWDTTYSTIRVYIGNHMIVEGDTKETGFFSIHGTLSKSAFRTK